jgi:MarR family transcriptional regulator, organic hydroperoxide resistance regulator
VTPSGLGPGVFSFLQLEKLYHREYGIWTTIQRDEILSVWAMTKSLSDKDELAARVWGMLFDYLMASNSQRSGALQRRGMTPNDSRALLSLATVGRPIGELAREWQSDPSNATWIVDRLEKAGLAERQPSPQDRRVKLVLLTAKGARVQAELMAEFRDPPTDLAALGVLDLMALESVMKKLQTEG